MTTSSNPIDSLSNRQVETGRNRGSETPTRPLSPVVRKVSDRVEDSVVSLRGHLFVFRAWVTEDGIDHVLTFTVDGRFLFLS